MSVVAAEWADWSVPTPEVRGSNPVIGEFINIFSYCQLYWNDENEEKEAGIGPLKYEYF